jgi:2,3-dihydroxybenzoate decarboxylase
LGTERVMFAADYPFESAQESAEFIDGAPIAEAVRQAICFDNAAKLLRLPKP